MKNSEITIYRSAIANPQPDKTIQFFHEGALVVDNSGEILFVGEFSHAIKTFPVAEKVEFSDSIIFPGFVDTHAHLPQFPAIGQGRGELLDWLNETIFPLEARFADEEFARINSRHFFREALSAGTTTMSVFCSPHFSATDIAFETALQAGIRVCMGRTMMDLNAPKNLLASVEKNISESLELAKKWHGAGDGRLEYSLTPRFAGSCSSELMRKCGEISRAENLRIQSHLAENPAEISWIRELFPDCNSYTEVYERHALLSERTIMAHCIYLNPQEENLIKKYETAIAHCPTSNRFLQSGVMSLKKYDDCGFRIGLGTDVAGGYSISVLNEAKEAVESSKTWKFCTKSKNTEPISSETALFLATLGGAEALNLAQKTGNFAKGKFADFVVLDFWEFLSPIAEFPEHSELFLRLLYCATSRVVKSTFVHGRKVFERK